MYEPMQIHVVHRDRQFDKLPTHKHLNLRVLQFALLVNCRSFPRVSLGQTCAYACAEMHENTRAIGDHLCKTPKIWGEDFLWKFEDSVHVEGSLKANEGKLWY